MKRPVTQRIARACLIQLAAAISKKFWIVVSTPYRLWQRNKRFYARFSVEGPFQWSKQVHRVPLKGVETVAEARKELDKLLTRREDQDLPPLKRAPKFEDYVETYLAHLDVVVDAKRPATVQKARYILRQWSKHLGETRLNHIDRAVINAFIAKRQVKGVSGRTVIDVIVLRNVLNRAGSDERYRLYDHGSPGWT